MAKGRVKTLIYANGRSSGTIKDVKGGLVAFHGFPGKLGRGSVEFEMYTHKETGNLKLGNKRRLARSINTVPLGIPKKLLK